MQRSTPIAADGLRGWRAVVPEGRPGYLDLRLEKHAPVALRVTGEVPLVANLPLVRAMLAQGGPDAQVTLSLIVGGQQSPRLEIRRYHDDAKVVDERLVVGLPRDRRTERGLRGVQGVPMWLHAVDLSAPEVREPETVTAGCVLPEVLGEAGGPWLIQARLDGRAQRAVSWSPQPQPFSTREARIAAYQQAAGQWVGGDDDTPWDALWQVIAAVGRGGDAGVADQVQAVAGVPEVLARLLLRAPHAELAEALALDMAAPIFWPILPVGAVCGAVAVEFARRTARFARFAPTAEAEDVAWQAMAGRIAAVLALHPALAGHFGCALAETRLIVRAVSPEYQPQLLPVFQARGGRLKERNHPVKTAGSTGLLSRS
jgi:hypothetical protein